MLSVSSGHCPSGVLLAEAAPLEAAESLPMTVRLGRRKDSNARITARSKIGRACMEDGERTSGWGRNPGFPARGSALSMAAHESADGAPQRAAEVDAIGMGGVGPAWSRSKLRSSGCSWYLEVWLSRKKHIERSRRRTSASIHVCHRSSLAMGRPSSNEASSKSVLF